MEMDHGFEVALPPDRAWATLMDVERIAPCMPGAELTEVVDGRRFRGRVSARLGPVALTFDGEAEFEEVDEEARRATVSARGSDAKGRGGAQARIAFALSPSGGGSRVDIHTDLQLSGSVAQYGRGVGMVQDLAGRIIGQFADNLAAAVAADGAAPAPDAPGPDAPGPDAPAAPPAPAAPVDVGGMALAAAWRRVVDWLRGLLGGGR